MKPKHQCHLSQWVEWVYDTQSLKERRLLCEYMFIPTDRWTLILKMIEREAFLTKPKHPYHLSQWGEWVYGSSPWKEWILLCESMFILINRWALILKMVEKEAFPMKPKHQCHYPNEENEFMVPNLEKKEDYYMNLCLSMSQFKDKLQF